LKFYIFHLPATQGGDTLTIHPITFSTPNPEDWNAHYKTIVPFPNIDEQ